MVNLPIMLEEKLLYPANYSIRGLDLFEEKLTSFKINTNFEGKTGGVRKRRKNEKRKTQSMQSNCAPVRNGQALQPLHATASIQLWQFPHLQQPPPTGTRLVQSQLPAA